MYRGQIFDIPVAGSGLVGTKNQTNIPPDRLILAQNIAWEGGVIKKEGGMSKYNSSVISGAPNILGGWDWWPTVGTQRMVVATDGNKLLKDTGAGTFATTLKSGMTAFVNAVFVEAGLEVAGNNRKLFIFTGTNQVQVLSGDGATTADIATPPADWAGANNFPIGGVNHTNRLWGYGNQNDPSRLYYSTLGTHEDFTGAGSGSLPVFPGEGEGIVCVVSFKGVLVIWKYPKGIYLAITTDPSPANWTVTRLTTNIGGLDPQGAILVDDDVMYMDNAGNIHLLSATLAFGDMASRNISKQENIYWFFQDNVNLGKLKQARGIYYSAKREVHFALTGSGDTVNTKRLVLDLNKQEQTISSVKPSYVPGDVRFRFSDRDNCTSLWLRKDANNIPRPISGDNAGFVWNMDQAAKDKAGAAYLSKFQTPYMDFSWIDPKLETKRKMGDFLELIMSPIGNWNAQVDVFWDGNFVQSIFFNMGTNGAGLGTFTLDTDVLAGDQVVNRKKRLIGSGRRLSLALSNNGTDQDFSIGRMAVHCRIGDERLGIQG